MQNTVILGKEYISYTDAIVKCGIQTLLTAGKIRARNLLMVCMEDTIPGILFMAEICTIQITSLSCLV